jgi:hypothetical protein
LWSLHEFTFHAPGLTGERVRGKNGVAFGLLPYPINGLSPLTRPAERGGFSFSIPAPCGPFQSAALMPLARLRFRYAGALAQSRNAEGPARLFQFPPDAPNLLAGIARGPVQRAPVESRMFRALQLCASNSKHWLPLSLLNWGCGRFVFRDRLKQLPAGRPLFQIFAVNQHAASGPDTTQSALRNPKADR